MIEENANRLLKVLESKHCPEHFNEGDAEALLIDSLLESIKVESNDLDDLDAGYFDGIDPDYFDYDEHGFHYNHHSEQTEDKTGKFTSLEKYLTTLDKSFNFSESSKLNYRNIKGRSIKAHQAYKIVVFVFAEL